MNKAFVSFLSFSVVLISVSLVQASEQILENTRFRIFLDPGHGGKDHGVVHKKIREADLVLDFVQYLQEQLLNNPNYEVTVSRTQDESISLEDRVTMAHESQSDLYLSFHVNSTPDSQAQGIEMFFKYPAPAEGKLSSLDRIRHDLHEVGRAQKNLHFARLVKKSLRENEKTFGKTRILIKQAPFYVISKPQIPAILMELGFLTHPREREKLLQASYRKEIAQQFIHALDLFVSTHEESRDKAPAKSLD